MITPADDFGDRAELDPDDPLTVVLQPEHGRLAAPRGRYEEIRRGAGRRRALRVVAGAGLTCAVVGLAVLVPMRMAGREEHAPPAIPLAPAPASSPGIHENPSGGSTSVPEPARPTPSDPSEGAVSPVPDSRNPRSSLAPTASDDTGASRSAAAQERGEGSGEPATDTSDETSATRTRRSG